MKGLVVWLLAGGLALAQPAPRRFLVAHQERLRFPEVGTLPPEAQVGGICGWEKKGDIWFVTGLVPGQVAFDWGKTHWEVLVRERAFKPPPLARLSVFGGYPAASALLHWARDFLHPRAELKEQKGQLLARGAELIAFEGLPKVEVKEQDLPARKADGLILSNWPEKIEADQVLLDTALAADCSWRVMVHHRNLPEQPPRWLEVELVQPPESDQRYAVSSFLAGPSNDEIFAGHLAASRFFREVTGPRPQGYLVAVGKGQRHLVERSWLKPGQTVSAMLSLRALHPGPPARLRILARQPDNLEPLEMQSYDPTARTSRGVFPAEILRELTYKVGPAYLFEDIGGQPYLKEVEAGYASPGNFGAVYRYRWNLDNSTDQDHEVRMEISARGGPARACLWLDGESIETELLKAEPRVLKRWLLPAGTRLPVAMELFPQAGSNFPLSVTLSSRAATGALPPATPIDLEWFIP